MKPVIDRLFAFGALVALLSSVAMAQQPPAKTGCDAFTWDVSRELAVLGQSATTVKGGKGGTEPAVRLEVGKHYVAHLAPQSEVQLAAKPGKPMLDDGARAGVFTFHVAEAGSYRVSITSGHWLDVVDGGNVVASRDFQGQRGCERVHKIVEFELSGDRDMVLQLTGGTVENVGIAITAVAKPS